jgi:PAS domain S-box-containing protein
MSPDYETFLSEERPGVLCFGGARMALLDVEAGFWGLRRQMEALVGRQLTDTVLQQAGVNGGASFARSFVKQSPDADGAQALRDCVTAYQAAGFGRFEVEILEWPIGRVIVHGKDTFEAWMKREHDRLPESPVCAYTAGVLVGFVNALTGRHDIVCIQHTCQARGDDACQFELLPVEDAAGAQPEAQVVALKPDPGLGLQINLLEILFDRMPMGIAIFDRDYILQRCNPTWAGFVEHYGPPSARPALPGVPYSELAPGAEATAYPLFKRVLQGETIRQNAVRLDTAGGDTSYWDVVLAPLVETTEGTGNERVTGILNVTIDVTERIEAQQALAQHRDRLEDLVKRRTAALTQANEQILAERNFVAAVMDTAGALVLVLDREGRIVRFNRACERTTGYTFAEVRGKRPWDLFLTPPDIGPVRAIFENLKAGQFPSTYENDWLTKSGERRRIAWSNTAITTDGGDVQYVVATGIDVTERQQVEQQLRQARDQLEQRVAERTAEIRWHAAFENLITNVATNFINLPPGEVDEGIDQALHDAGQFLDVDRSYVFLYASDRRTMSNTHEWCAEGIAPQIHRMGDMPTEALGWSNQILLDGEVLHIPRVADLPPEAAAEREEFQGQGAQSLIAAPMVYQGETIGFVGFDAVRAEHHWSPETVRLLKMLGTIFVNALAHKRAQAIQTGQRQFLEILATGGNFEDTLHTLLQMIEEQWPGMQGLVLLLDDEGRLHRGASVSLPEAYVRSIEGLKIGPQVGSCGTACYLGQRVIVEDIAEDPRWDGLRDLALAHGLRACWSEPVFSSEGDVIGTFAMYYRHPRAPVAAELRTIEIGAHLVGIAIERERADEALHESQRMLTTLIGNLPGMAYRCRNDPDWTISFVSEGSLALTGYPPDALVENHDVAYGQLIHPEDQEMVREAVQSALDKRQHFEITYRLVTPDGEKWVWERGQGVYAPEGHLRGLEGFVTDITERVTARRHLEQRVAERTRELATLLESSHNVASTLALEPLLGLILDQLGGVVAYDAASTMILDGEMLDVLAYRGPISQAEALRLRFPTEQAGANRAVIRRREPVIVEDIRSDEPLARALRETAGKALDTTYHYLRCWMGVPLIVKGNVVGMLTLDHGEAGYYTAHHAELAMAFANQVAVAIENARLYQAEQDRLEESERRRRVAEGLRDILGVLNSNCPLAEVLEAIVAQALHLLHADGGAIYRLNVGEEADTISVVTAQGMPRGFAAVGAFPIAPTAANQAIMQRRPFAVPDFSTMPAASDLDALPPVLQKLSGTVREHFRASLTVPVEIEDALYGAITLYYGHPRRFSDEEIELSESFAHQAALAIANARLRDQVEEVAVAAERRRLARDLHDAVTQTLFSASLIADVLPRIWERQPEEGLRRLDELRELTRGALAEMRTLLLELRPSALVDAEMSALLRQLAESITGRARVPVAVEIEGDCDLPDDAKVTFYRIAQESLNNVAKHAGATRAIVRLACRPRRIKLTISDDGYGFDPETIPPESLGVGIMRERAASIGATLAVESEIGRGTTVTVVWKKEKSDGRT